jgi:exodeoxyribonuclease VIII
MTHYKSETMTNEQYHADPAISRSGLILFAESPYKYWAEYINPNRPPKKSTPAMEFGSAFHSLVLEPEKFRDEYIVAQELQKLPKVGLLKNLGRPEFDRQKAERAKIEFINDALTQEWLERAEGKIILSLADWQQLTEMRDALRDHEEAWALIGGAKYEQSYFWQDPGSGLMVKSRPDILHDNIIVDLKTCVSASPRAYQRSMVDGGYHIQAAMVRDAIRTVEGREVSNFLNLCIEKTYPYAIGIKIISQEALDEGERFYKEKLLEMKCAIENNLFPSYEPEEVDLPLWY